MARIIQFSVIIIIMFHFLSIIKRSQYLDPLNWRTNFNLGVLFMQNGRTLTALNHFLTCLKVNKTFAPGYSNLGLCLYILGDYPNAMNALKFAYKLDTKGNFQFFIMKANFTIILFLPIFFSKKKRFLFLLFFTKKE